MLVLHSHVGRCGVLLLGRSGDVRKGLRFWGFRRLGLCWSVGVQGPKDYEKIRVLSCETHIPT